MDNDVIFGPSGRGENFSDLNMENFVSLLSSNGLFAFEYSFGRGVRLSDSVALELAQIFNQYNIQVSVHAPYYINLANKKEDMIFKSFKYIKDSIVKMKILGANRLIFHPASLSGLDRQEAFELTYNNLRNLISLLKKENLLDSNIQLCPETMGKHGQIGTVDEIVKLCEIDECLIPTLDFGHINAFGQGSLKSQEDFENIFIKLKNKLGERGRNVHIHFSKIEYTAKGEKRHLNFSDTGEPDYKLLLLAMKKLGINGRVISESAGHQFQDSITMKNFYKNK